jgi:hypothetical protein
MSIIANMHFLEAVQDVLCTLYFMNINGVQREEILITKMPVALQSRVYIQFIAVAECILDQNLLRFGFEELEFTVKPPKSRV